MSNPVVTISKLSKEVAKAAEIRAALQEHDDPKLILDMIEGETNLHEAVAVIYEETLDDISLAAGLEAMIRTFQERHSRIIKSIETRRTLILMAMDRAGVSTIRVPTATLSIGKSPARAVITDETQIPARFWKQAEPTLSKGDLTKALKDGEKVAGAELSNGGIQLTIRAR